jgi:gas vesicle structural protein
MTMSSAGAGYLQRPGGGTLADVIDIILDKGMVIDAYVRVSLIGIEILTIDARIVIASVDTYLRFAEAVNRLDLTQTGEQKGLPQMVEDMTQGGAKTKTQGALEGAKDALFGSDSDEDDQREQQPARQRRSSSGQPKRRVAKRGRSGGENS